MEGVTHDVSRIERREKMRERERELRISVDDVKTMTDAIDGVHGKFHAGLDDVYMSSEEMKGQIRIIKERQAWLIGELDKLRDELRADK